MTTSLRRLPSLKLPTSSISIRATLGMVLVAAFGVALTALASWYTLSREIDQTLKVKTDWSLRVAAEAFISYYPDFRIDYGADGEVLRLKGPAIADFADNDAVDRISRINKGTATVFRFDPARNDFVRLTTSVKKADGTRAVGTVLGNTGVVFPVIMRGEVFKGVAHILGIPYQTGYLPIFANDSKPSGILYIGVGKLEELRASTDMLYAKLLIAVLAALVIAAVVGHMIARSVTAPVVALAGVTERIADGQIASSIAHKGRQDEIGTLARAIDRLNQFVAERAQFQEALERRAEQDKGRSEYVQQAIEAFRLHVKQALAGMAQGTRRMDEASARIAEAIDGNKGLSQDSTLTAKEAASEINEVAAAAAQLSRAIREVADRAGDTSRIVDQAVTIGEGSRADLSELSAAANKIGQVVGVIRVIAEQTNLLALNATIEAARAGEAGRGFAVVAGEVKQLADQTSRATNEVADQVTSIQTVSESVISGFATLLEALQEINRASTTISSAVEEQGSATASIAASAERASRSAVVLGRAVSGIDAALAESTVELETFTGVSLDLNRQATDLGKTVESFLTTVAA